MPNRQRSVVMDLVQSGNCPRQESGVQVQMAAVWPSPALLQALPEPAAVPPSQSPGTGAAAQAEPPQGDRELCQPLNPLVQLAAKSRGTNDSSSKYRCRLNITQLSARREQWSGWPHWNVAAPELRGRR